VYSLKVSVRSQGAGVTCLSSLLRMILLSNQQSTAAKRHRRDRLTKLRDRHGSQISRNAVFSIERPFRPGIFVRIVTRACGEVPVTLAIGSAGPLGRKSAWTTCV
jgi:hypothetical protein